MIAMGWASSPPRCLRRLRCVGGQSGACATAFLVGSVAGPVVGAASSSATSSLAYAGVVVLTVLVAGSLLHGRVGRRPGRQATTTVTFAAAFRAPPFRPP